MKKQIAKRSRPIPTKRSEKPLTNILAARQLTEALKRDEKILREIKEKGE